MLKSSKNLWVTFDTKKKAINGMLMKKLEGSWCGFMLDQNMFNLNQNSMKRFKQSFLNIKSMFNFNQCKRTCFWSTISLTTSDSCFNKDVTPDKRFYLTIYKSETMKIIKHFFLIKKKWFTFKPSQTIALCNFENNTLCTKKEEERIVFVIFYVEI